jgi:hypothetical protein
MQPRTVNQVSCELPISLTQLLGNYDQEKFLCREVRGMQKEVFPLLFMVSYLGISC